MRDGSSPPGRPFLARPERRPRRNVGPSKWINVYGTSTMEQLRLAAERTLLARAPRKRVLAARFSALLYLAGLGFADLRAVAQEGMVQHRGRTPAAVLTAAREKVKAAKPGSEFKECENGCPGMIVIPPGTFTMGSPGNELGREITEGPQHKVTIAAPFAVSKFEVTFEEW